MKIKGDKSVDVARYTVLALIVSAVLMGVKFVGWRLTMSQAVYSDFLESIVNILTGIAAIFVVRYAAKPADRGHPYGHGKIEYISAAFEGLLIFIAAVMIFWEAFSVLFAPNPAHQLGIGAAIVFVCGVANLALGVWLKRLGLRIGSPAIVANGEHIISDFYTSAGVTLGLAIAYVTGLSWIDPLVAILVGGHLGWTGLRVVRHSMGGLLDEEDFGYLRDLERAFSLVDFGDIIQIHHVRILRSGRFHHIDAHVVVPEFWNVAEAHDRTEEFEKRLLAEYRQPGDLRLHIDPCRRAYCRHCDVRNCPIRLQAFENRIEIDLESMIGPEAASFLFKKSQKNI